MSENSFRQCGEYWVIVYDGQTAHVRHTKGFAYLSQLLAQPDAALHVLDLVTAGTAAAVNPPGDAAVAHACSERARLNVGRAIHAALKKLEQHHPALALHLQRTVNTGTRCRYTPDPRVPVAWET